MRRRRAVSPVEGGENTVTVNEALGDSKSLDSTLFTLRLLLVLGLHLLHLSHIPLLN